MQNYHIKRIKELEAEVELLQAELDLADEIHYDEIKAADRYNDLLAVLVLCMALWIADLTARHWNCL
jgi:hypothetical protein